MSTINFIVKIITFFGTVFRASVEQLACRKRRLLVEDARYFTKGALCGHTLHEPFRTRKDAGTVCLRPLFAGFFLGLCLLIPSSFSLFYMESFRPVTLFFFWIGISLWTNLFPSQGDAAAYTSLSGASGGRPRNGTAALLRLGARLESAGLTLLTSILASFLLAQIARLLLPLFHNPVAGI